MPLVLNTPRNAGTHTAKTGNGHKASRMGNGGSRHIPRANDDGGSHTDSGRSRHSTADKSRPYTGRTVEPWNAPPLHRVKFVSMVRICAENKTV